MLSIIIPTFQEEARIYKLLDHLADSLSGENICEIIVADGGSRDRTTAKVKRFMGENPSVKIRLISAEKGRAKQMNAGYRNADGEVLYFLHADSFPPKDFDALILAEVKKGNLAGCFRMKFDYDHWWLNLMGWFTQLPWRACRGGDQSQFITRKLFEQLGGFDENYIVYEDNILINKLYKRGIFKVIQEPLTTSARLYRMHGVGYVQYHFLIIYLKKWLGANPDQLFDYYKKHLQQRKPKKRAKSRPEINADRKAFIGKS